MDCKDRLIMVVEDEPFIQSMLGRMIEDIGYQVRLTGSGGESLLAIEEGRLRPDLVITDLMMPGMDGTTLADHLARVAPKLKILFISGYGEDSIGNDGTPGSGRPFLQKPFTSDDLAAKISQILG